MVVLVLLGAGLLVLGEAMTWTSESSRLNDRNNEYYTTAAAAEASTEKVLVRISRDYIAGGETAVYGNLSVYPNVVPTTSDDAYWGNYTFSNPDTGATGLYVNRLNPSTYVVLAGQYAGLNGYRATYRISANAKLTASRYGIIAGVRQDIGVESIPLFQFAIFYNMDMEINPSPAMVVTGRVHGNSNIYTLPSTSLTFSNDITASGLIYQTNMPTDPQGNRGIGTPNITYIGKHDGGTSTLNLPIGTNNQPTNVFQVMQMPPAGESPTSAMGTNRYYNKANLIIRAYDPTNMFITNGLVFPNGQKTNGLAFPTMIVTNGISLASALVPSNQWGFWLTFTNTFYDTREATTVRALQVDVSKFRLWTHTNTLITLSNANQDLNVVFMDDLRTNPIITITTNITSPNGTNIYKAVYTTNNNIMPAIRMANGSQLPVNGLTVATPNPIYIWGNYNVTTNGLVGQYSTNVNSTYYTAPASLCGDAISILSSAWNDANSSLSLSSRNASTTTVNAALLGGIVPTTTSNYSGGVENFPRFLEDWSGDTLWYNGSMVVLYTSFTATSPWGGSSIYNPPARNWAFDQNFYSITKLPPATPQILFMERLSWAFHPPTSD